MHLTVIIPTRNRATLLGKALESMLLQSLPGHDFEVIVADNGSTDLTKEICNEFKNRFINFKYCYDQTPGLHVGRHRGLMEAASDILVYADDDIEAMPTWLEAIWTSFQDPSVMLVGGNNYPLYEKEPPAWLTGLWIDSKMVDGHYIGYFSILDFGATIKNINPYYVFGCNFSIRKPVLIEAGGFHPDSMPQPLIKFRGDGESAVSAYVLQKGYKVIFNPQASVHHFVSNERMSLEYLKKRNFNQGISDSYTSLRNGNTPRLKKTRGALTNIANNFSKPHAFAGLKLLKQLFKTAHGGYLSLQMTSSYNSGYNYHQSEYMKDPALRDWVHKENYYA
jgi:glucosyl-dolichyl phosphate glucuronosyltransferase